MKRFRPFPLPLLLGVLFLAMAGAGAVCAQAPPTLDNGYRNVFGTGLPDGVTFVDEAGVRHPNPPDGTPKIPVGGEPLFEAYQAQRQSGTAFGGFPGNGYGTLSTVVTAGTPDVHTAAAVVTTSPIPDNDPKSVASSEVPGSVRLGSAIIGRPLALFNISYSFGGEIPPPEEFDLATGEVKPGFYRAEPLNARIKTPVVSATDLTPTGEPPVNATGADADGYVFDFEVDTHYLVGLNPQFYWSKHAKKVYATQAGTITVEWREAATPESETKTYVIASSPAKPERTLFWTENGFNGPLVEVPAGRINAVNFIYNSLVPKVVREPYAPWLPGLTDFAETDPAKKRYKTIYYETNLIHAYNVEGRVFIEYLGNPRGDGTNEPKGTEIVNVIKEVTPGTVVVELGEEVGPEPVAGGAVALEPKIIAGQGVDGVPYLHQHLSNGGTKPTLYGIKETQPGVTSGGELQQVSNEVLVYWMETSTEGQLNLKWPKQYLGYVLEWPELPGERDHYSIYARPDAAGAGGEAAARATAVALDSANNPALVHQDDASNTQAVLLPDNAFYTRVSPGNPTNRALLRYTRDEDIWFERVFSQLDPYYYDPAQLEPYLRSGDYSVTNGTDYVTGDGRIRNVVVSDEAGTPYVEGVDYVVDYANGVIRRKETVVVADSIADWSTDPTTTVNGWSYGYYNLTQDPGATYEQTDFTPFPATAGAWSASNYWDRDNNRYDWYAGNPPWTSIEQELGVSNGSNAGDEHWVIRRWTATSGGKFSARVKARKNDTGANGDGVEVKVFHPSAELFSRVVAKSDSVGFDEVVDLGEFSAGDAVDIALLPRLQGFNDSTYFSVQIFDSPRPLGDSVHIAYEQDSRFPFSEVPDAVDYAIGERIEPAAGLGADAYGETDAVYVGYIHQASGTAFDVDAYRDPFEHGFDEAAGGAIIGVNDLDGNNELEVWWYRKSAPAGEATAITGSYWPSFVQKYKLTWPESPSEIVLASNAGSGDLPSLQAAGEVYTRNDPAEPGYNPNEEHALALNGRVWALRDDLNLAGSSEPYVLWRYTEADERPAMRVFKVLREKGAEVFDYPAIAGKPLQAPMPLPLMADLPFLEDGSLASYEVPGVADPQDVGADFGGTDAAFAHYQKFTWTDRKGGLWVYRGPHGGNVDDPQDAAAPTLKMRYFYKTLEGFDFPGRSVAVGTITPYLRGGSAGAYVGDPVTGSVEGLGEERKEQPLDIVFRPQWPAAAPTLRVGETLTLPKLGLPSVRGQASAELIYQQSVAVDEGSGAMAGRKKSARLFDPTRAKVYPLGNLTASKVELRTHLTKIPDSVNTSPFLGKIYFPNLPPHLSGRLYFDPAVGTYGSLVFKGQFMDELVGEKYLQLNVMSAADLAAAIALIDDGEDDDKKTKWRAAIEGLATTVETFIEDPGKRGTFIPLEEENGEKHRPWPIVDGVEIAVPEEAEPLVATEGTHAREPVLPEALAEIFYSDSAVDSYAVSASGGGAGYVVLATGDGRDTDFTPAGLPVSLQVFKVEAPLYRGELKVIASQNPLDEKLTMQHTGDFAGHPEEYDFEWCYAPPVDGLPRKLYSFVHEEIVGDAGNWRQISNPGLDVLNPANDYPRFRSVLLDEGEIEGEMDGYLLIDPTEGALVIDDGGGEAANGTTQPNAILRRTFDAGERPLRLFLSLDVGRNDGAVVYLNGDEVAAYHAPGYVDSATTTVPKLPGYAPLELVFEVNPNSLVAGSSGDVNVLAVELYTTADAGSATSFGLKLEGSLEVENLTGWLALTHKDDERVDYSGMPDSDAFDGITAVTGKNRHTIEGSSILTLSDNYLIMRYRAKDLGNAAYVPDGGWSKWTEPQLAEGWIKRVLAGINPFQQRVKDLFNHETNTSVSLVEQAGKRWEGDIALNLDNINDSGLIEIYETVLRRGKDLSISGTPAINYGGANDALLLAAGYLSDLYMILGNEAYADAANSTIAFNTDSAANFITQYGDVATAMYAFKGQLASVLDEELALLRGRDDSLLPGTSKTPIYNRLIWNYTRGIDAGEAIYALNYNIKDVEWDYSINPNNAANLPADGIISAADAAIAYPQGHGDAYGHYLTALTGYYGLLNNPNFTWTPRIEAVLVLGTPVSVDYQDERKFAAAAAAVGRTASRTLDLTYRKEFSADDEDGWSELHDETTNANSGRTRNWGTDDWASRGGQGALLHWVTANSLLPSVDPNPNHSGIQKIDRTTVPELAEIVAQAEAIQQTLDNADGRLNPLGLAAGGLTFDISPVEVDAGRTHYEQIFERATGALGNAVSAFDNAKGSTRFLRQQEDTLADQRNAIEAQEQAFTNQLIELYGTPYTDDIGPGRTYKQGYDGPDLVHPMYVDLPEIFNNDLEQRDYSLLLDPQFVADNGADLNYGRSVSFTLTAKGEVVTPEAWSGRRVSPGRMQTAVSNLLLARQTAADSLSAYQGLQAAMTQQIDLYEAQVDAHDRKVLIALVAENERRLSGYLIEYLEGIKSKSEAAAESIRQIAGNAAASLPYVVGLANDASAAARAAVLKSGEIASKVPEGAAHSTAATINKVEGLQKIIENQLKPDVEAIEWAMTHRQLLSGLRDSLASFTGQIGALDEALRHLDQAQRDLYALQAEGDRVQKQRLVFRQHAAAIVQGYRTRDFAFRAFRDEALERYNALFDLAARYTYLAARAYDYETGLLDPDGNAAAAGFYEKIVGARALGVVSDGVPQFAGASGGDPGLSGVLAEMAGDWSVAKTRLGFNNPDRYRTTFSLRQENFRIIPGTEGDGDWKDLLDEAKMANILDDPDVRRHAMQTGGDQSGLAVPGIVLAFSTTIDAGYNFFGKPLAAGDHGFSPTSFATKIRSSGVAFEGYVGMDDPTSLGGALGGIGAASPEDPNLGFNDLNGLSATPYIYLIPAGVDMMRSPPLGDTDTVRAWTVEDQAIPLPFNIAGSDYSTQPAWVSAASLSEPAFMLRKHQAFRAVPDGTVFSSAPGFTNSRLVGRSVWNSQWKIVIPGNTLLNDPKEGLRIFLETVKDIKLHFESYSYSGN